MNIRSMNIVCYEHYQTHFLVSVQIVHCTMYSSIHWIVSSELGDKVYSLVNLFYYHHYQNFSKKTTVIKIPSYSSTYESACILCVYSKVHQNPVVGQTLNFDDNFWTFCVCSKYLQIKFCCIFFSVGGKGRYPFKLFFYCVFLSPYSVGSVTLLKINLIQLLQIDAVYQTLSIGDSKFYLITL